MTTVVHLFQIDLELLTPGGVSAPESVPRGSRVRPSLPLSRDTHGRPYIPPTSIAGSLRAVLHGDDERQNILFGHIRQDVVDDPGAVVSAEDATQSAPSGQASTVHVLGSQVILPEDHAVQVRRRTAIDRRRGAAAERTLHVREVLPTGTTVRVWLRHDTSATAPQPTDPPAELLDVLSRWQPYIGGGRTTGHGRARIEQVTHRAIDLRTSQGRKTWLTTGGPPLLTDAQPVTGRTWQPGTIPLLHGKALTFDVVDAVHIGVGRREERSVDGQRRTGVATIVRNSHGRPIIPGSTWKGVLRSRIEFILRSVGLHDDCGLDGPSTTCGQCDVCRLFGAAKAKNDQGGLRGTLVVDDSLLEGGRERVRNHVALDRVTGGASDGLLYSGLVVEDATVALHLHTLDRGDAAGNEPGEDEGAGIVLAALDLALWDLHEGLIGLGGATTRGYGTLRADPDTEHLLSRRAHAARTALAHAKAARAVSNPPATTTGQDGATTSQGDAA